MFVATRIKKQNENSKGVQCFPIQILVEKSSYLESKNLPKKFERL